MHKTLGALLILSFVAVSANSSSPGLEPGLYRVTVGVSGRDLPAGLSERSMEHCLTEDDLSADPRSILGDDSNMEGCSVSKLEFDNGRISMQMECKVEGGEATAVSRGTYSARSYELVTTMTMTFGYTSMEMESSVRGERIGDC